MNALFTRAKQSMQLGGVDMDTATIKAVLVDTADYGLQVSGVTNADPSTVTTGTHGLSVGDIVLIGGVLGATGVNGYHTVATVPNTTTFTVDLASAPGVYTSGGYVIKLSTDEFLSDVPAGARIGTPQTLANCAVNVKAEFTADNISFPSVSGDQAEALVIYIDTGVEGTSRLLAFIDSATGLPVTPNSGNINVTWPTPIWTI